MNYIETTSKNFNRYWLRFGPSIAVTSLLSFFYVYKIINNNASNISAISKSISNTWIMPIIFMGVVVGITYLFTWPGLFLHIFRFSMEDQQKLANKRNLNKGSEFIDTIRHRREFGSAFINSGSSIIHMLLFGNLLFKYTDFSCQSWVNIVLFVTGILTFVIGFIVYYQSVQLECLPTTSNNRFSYIISKETDTIPINNLGIRIVVGIYFIVCWITTLFLGCICILASSIFLIVSFIFIYNIDALLKIHDSSSENTHQVDK